MPKGGQQENPHTTLWQTFTPKLWKSGKNSGKLNISDSMAMVKSYVKLPECKWFLAKNIIEMVDFPPHPEMIEQSLDGQLHIV